MSGLHPEITDMQIARLAHDFYDTFRSSEYTSEFPNLNSASLPVTILLKIRENTATIHKLQNYYSQHTKAPRLQDT